MKNKLIAPPFRITSKEIAFKNVYYNGFHSLKQVGVENLTAEMIVVKLDSTLKDQISFQLENENVIKDMNPTTESLATNTAAWTNFTATQDLSHFNQLFNYVNYIDHIQLQPNQKLMFVIAFLPIIPDSSVASNLIPITGSVLFTSDDYTLNLNFHATVCQSILAADDLNTGLMFEDSLVGETYIKHITIHNQSAIDLYWRLNTLDLMSLKTTASHSINIPTNNWLQFVDASTFTKLDQTQPRPILPFSHYTFQVLFTPKEVGKFSYDLQIENINDVQNIIQTKIHATMRTFMHQNTLVITSGNNLEFGDCISGNWNSQQIALYNISESSIEVQFIADGAELVFDVMVKPEDKLTAVMSSTSDIKSCIYKSDLLENGQFYPSNDTRSYSSTTSHDTSGLAEGYSSASSNVSTDLDNIDMISAFNTIYYTSSNSSATTTSIKQVALTTEECNTKIEDMVLKPGAERVIQVSYRSPVDAPTSVNAGQFIRRNFNIMLQYRPNKSTNPKELKIIQCTARTCTSFVQVTPQVIDFGDTGVGTQKSFPIQIINQSDICAHVKLEFESKVLNCTQNELLIQPKSTIEIKLDIYPRKVNMLYRRQIKLKNYLNPDNDQIIEVSSTNTDRHNVTFHSLFYRILTPTGANFLDFGPIALNSPAIRTCTLVNTRDASLLLGISTSSQHEIMIYTKKKNKTSPASSNETEIKKHTITPSITAKKSRTRLTNAQYNSTAYLDLASVSHQRLSSIKHRRNIARQITNKSRTIKKLTDTCISVLNNSSSAIKAIDVDSTIKTTIAKETIVASNHLKSTTFITQHKRYRKKKQTCVGITGTTTMQVKRVKERVLDRPDISGKFCVSLNDLISILENGSLSRTSLFARQSLEEQFVKYQMAWRTELFRLIQKGELISTSLLQLNPKEEEQIIIVYTPKAINHSLTLKNAASISFRLIDFDTSAITTSSSSNDEEDSNNAITLHQQQQQRRPRYYKDFIPVLRKVIVRAQICRSCMELGQKNINFGIVDRGNRHHKTIVLYNKSETPLIYTIKKSGSIASSDIHLGAGRHGVIRAFGKKEIGFTFIPTLPGSFVEHLEVVNVRDKEDTNIVLLKAMIRRPESFTIKPSLPELFFSACKNDDVNKETIIVTNTNKQSRMFEIRMEYDNVQPQQPYKVEFFIDHGYQQNEGMFLSKDEEEEIENLEQKLKIAERKNQPEKIKKYLKKLFELKKQRQHEDLSHPSSEDVMTTIEDEKMAMKQEIINEDNVLFFLGSNASKSISVCFRTVTEKTNNEGQTLLQQTSILFSGRILINEHRNIDARKIISFSVNSCKDHEICLP